MAYSAKVSADIRRWVAEGLIEAAAGDKLLRDVEMRAGRALGLGAVLAMLAALLFAAALLAFVAADWDAIPRVLRTAGLLTLVAALVAGGIVLKRRDLAGLGEAVWLAASASWGAAVVLVGQMYDLPGDESAVILAWCGGTAIAAALLRSTALAVAAAGLATAWLCSEAVDAWDGSPFPTLYPALAAAVWLASLPAHAPVARNVLLLSLTAYAALLASGHDVVLTAGATAAIGAVLFVAAVGKPARVEQILKVDGHAPAEFFLAALTGLGMLQIDLFDDAAFVPAAAGVLAAIAGALLIGGKASRGVRRLGYLAFSMEIGVILVVTMGSMLDAAVFFLVAAAVLGTVAVLITRIEARLAPRAGVPAS